MGSFACCQVWRLRLREEGKPNPGKRSVCLKCGKKLTGAEMIPVVSWLVQRGRCRKCKEGIGWMELGCEVGMGVLFVAVYWLWPERMGGANESMWNWAGFAVFLAMLVGLLVLALYDGRWGKLPTVGLIFVVICAIIEVILVRSGGFVSGWSWGSFLGSLVLLGGLYLALYKVSREAWVGGGDWILALALAIALADVVLALLCLLVANLIGSVVAVVMLSRGKGRKARVPMGPLLIAGFLVVFFWGDGMRVLLGI
jgi:prepilin signal peptidase PulO-like enzyme (type II secretory pathway)